jgi:Leucine-rich repeat (LRR) protein
LSYNQLTSLIIANTALGGLECSDNQLTSLDVSQNDSLVSLGCSFNQLTSLDLRNGNNTIQIIRVVYNPDLFCIDVDDVAFSTTNWTVLTIPPSIDTTMYFSNNCSGTAIEEYSTNKELLKVTDLLGRETKQANQPLFYIYDDGTVEKRIVID